MKLAASFFVLLLVSGIYAASAGSIISIELDTDVLVPGEIVELTGSVESSLAGKPVGVEIKDSEGEIILIRSITTDSNGNFTLKFKIPSSASGELEIITSVEIDGQSFSESISVMLDTAAAEAAAEAAAAEAAVKTTVKIGEGALSFVDPSKGVKHYVERYTMEPDYKAWFERNYPDYTFYEGIGITESEYQEIVNQLTKPQPAAEQKVTAQTPSGGNEIIYVLIAVVAVGGGIGAVFIIKKGSKAPTVQQKPPSRRQKTVSFCGKCGISLIPGAKFCGKCGSSQS